MLVFICFSYHLFLLLDINPACPLIPDSLSPDPHSLFTSLHPHSSPSLNICENGCTEICTCNNSHEIVKNSRETPHDSFLPSRKVEPPRSFDGFHGNESTNDVSNEIPMESNNYLPIAESEILSEINANKQIKDHKLKKEIELYNKKITHTEISDMTSHEQNKSNENFEIASESSSEGEHNFENKSMFSSESVFNKSNDHNLTNISNQNQKEDMNKPKFKVSSCMKEVEIEISKDDDQPDIPISSKHAASTISFSTNNVRMIA